MRAETLILYEAPTTLGARGPVRRFIDHVGFTPADTIRIRGLAAALGLVVGGLGVSIVPTRAPLMRGNDICFAPLAEDRATYPVVLSTLRGTNDQIIASILSEVERLTTADLS